VTTGGTYREGRTADHVTCNDWANDQSYRCRFPSEYALANKVDHPRNVYLREAVVLRPIDTWLAQVFDPPRLADTLERLATSEDPGHVVQAEAARRSLADCNQRLARYRAALEAGTDPALIAQDGGGER
jgi:site-specific DNA recombinase